MAAMLGTAAFAQFQMAPKVDKMDNFRGLNAKAGYILHWEQIAAPFTANDLRTGESISLQSYLNAGKFVVIDYSATWCGPCWNLHQSGLLEQLNALNDFQVIWVESESTNSTDQIYGTSTDNTRAGYTCGNWVDPHGDGTPVPFPMIDDDAQGTCNATCANLNDNYVPLLILIAPNGQACNLRGFFSPQYVSESIQLIQYIATTYPQAGQAPQSAIEGAEDAPSGAATTFTALYNSIDPVTSVSWSAPGATPATGSGNTFTCTFNADGDYEVSVIVTNANGSDTAVHNINIYTMPEGLLSYTYGKEGDSPIGTGQNGRVYWAVAFPPSMLGNMPDVASVDCWVAADYAGSYTMKVYSGSATAPTTMLAEKNVNVTAAMANDNVRFDLANPAPVDQSKTLWIVMEATATYPAIGCDFTGDPNSDWISLNGTEWRHAADYGIDVSWVITAYSSALGIDNVLTNAEVAIFPNPATDRVNVKADGLQYVEVIDLEGRVLITNRTSNTVDISALSAGIYMFRVVTNNGVSTKKVVKK